VVKELVNHNANIEAKNEYGEIPLLCGIFLKNYTRTLKIIIFILELNNSNRNYLKLKN